MLTVFLTGCQEGMSNSEEKSQQATQNNQIDIQGVTVYTTAKDTDKRLTLTDELTFEPGVRLRALSKPLKPAQNIQH